VTSEKVTRVIKISSVRATRNSRLGIFSFIGLVLLLLLGIAWQSWPIVNVIIQPKQEQIVTDLAVNVFIGIAQTSGATATIPGRYLTLTDNREQLLATGYAMRTIDNETIIFETSALNQQILQSLKKIMPQGAILIPASLEVKEKSWQKLSAGNLYRAQVVAKASYYNELSFNHWSDEIIGLAITDARQILQSKVGVDQVKIEFYPFFLAKFSQKIPRDSSRLRFRLDTK